MDKLRTQCLQVHVFPWLVVYTTIDILHWNWDGFAIFADMLLTDLYVHIHQSSWAPICSLNSTGWHRILSKSGTNFIQGDQNCAKYIWSWNFKMQICVLFIACECMHLVLLTVLAEVWLMPYIEIWSDTNAEWSPSRSRSRYAYLDLDMHI